MFGKPGGPPRRPFMAAIHSLSSLLQNPRHLHSTNPKPTFQFSSPTPRAFWRCARDDGERDTTLPPPSPLTAAKRSLAVATGELFLGLASVLLRKRSSSSRGAVVLSGIDETRYSGSGNKVVSVVEEPVIWEQRPEDLEAERERRKVTSPGFSFSAAGLLFPYHLGVAQLLLEKGFIKETTPLAGSSAGAIVCVVISSGSSMKDALQATKILAEDCRLNGTAFRLGIRICAFPAKQIGLRDVGISPDCNPEDRAGPRQLFNWALEPAEDGVLDKLFELGYLDAEVWAEQNPIVVDDSRAE